MFIETNIQLSLLLAVVGSISNAKLAPLYKHKETISGEYIVVLKADTNLNDAVRDIEKAGIISITQTYQIVLNGFFAKIQDIEELNKIRQRHDVLYVEENGVVRAHSATWNQDRVDQRNLPLDHLDNYKGTGHGVHAYILDSGIYPENTYFTGRASVAYDAFGGDGIDCVGHGTHCAGILGSYEYGIAREATLYGVRVIDCTGYGTSDSLIAGLTFVALNHKNPGVVSMSLGTDHSPAIDTAVRALVHGGVSVAVSAGNNDQDACMFSPAREPTAITVGATDSSDKRAPFVKGGRSNYGSCLDIFAPGVDILSTWIGSTGATETLDGTSMACPHVAGAACIVLGQNNNLNAYQVKQILLDGATSDVISDPGYMSPNKLLYIGEVLDLQPRSTTSVPHTTRTSSTVTWNLDRVDQRNLPYDNEAKFAGSGSGVNAYIIDTGIYPENKYLTGRASVLFDAFQESGVDCNGHGTHSAGIVGSYEYGIAREATLYGVRVLNCLGYGTISSILAGLDYVALNHQKPAVASLSLGGGISPSLDSAVSNMVNQGVIVVVAAGNDNLDACNTSPAREPSAITVGATDEWDTRPSFSNYGRCLDIFAPGVSILSTWIGELYATETLNGTSMACQHVAGAACVVLGKYPSLTPYQLGTVLTNGGTPNVILNSGLNSPNRLLYIGPDLDMNPSPTTTLKAIYPSPTSSGYVTTFNFLLVVFTHIFITWFIT